MPRCSSPASLRTEPNDAEEVAGLGELPQHMDGKRRLSDTAPANESNDRVTFITEGLGKLRFENRSYDKICSLGRQICKRRPDLVELVASSPPLIPLHAGLHGQRTRHQHRAAV